MRLLVLFLAGCMALVAAGADIAKRGPATEPSPGPRRGVLYAGHQGEGEVRMVRIGERAGRPLLLLDVELECEGFTPEGRGVALVGPDGRFEVVLAATDTDTTDTVTGSFDDIDGKVRSDAAVLEIDVDVEGVDNAGPTGSCEDTQEWRLEGHRDPGATRVDGAVAVDADALAVGPTGVFALVGASGQRSEVRRIDPARLRRSWRVRAPIDATDLAAGGDAVWVLDDASLVVTRLDAATGGELARVPLVPPATARDSASVFTPIVATDTGAWIGIDGTGELLRIDGATSTVTARLATPGGVRALAAAPAGVIASVASPDAASRGGRLVRLDDGGGEVASIELDVAAAEVVFDGATAWVRDLDGAVTRRDPVTLGPLPGRFEPAAGLLVAGLIAAPPGAWMSTERGLLAVDESLVRAASIPVVGAETAAVSAGFDALWISDSGQVVHVAT